MTVKFYFSSVSGDRNIKHQQTMIENLLTSLKIEFVKLDISSDEEAKKKMRELLNDPKALPPQLFNEDQYCGNYEQLNDAKEAGPKEVKKFLKLEDAEPEQVGQGDD